MSNYSTLSKGLKLKSITVKNPDSKESKGRLDGFLKRCKVYGIVGTLSAATTLGLMTYGKLSSNNAFDVENMEKTDNYSVQDIVQNLGAHSLFANEKYIDNNNSVIIVSEKDHHLTKIIANADSSIAPKYSRDEDMNIFQQLEVQMFEIYHSLFNSENSNDKNWAFYNLNSDAVGPHALSIYEDNDLNKSKVCYMKPHKNNISIDDGYSHGQLGTRVFINGYEMINIVSNHEEGHCLDRGEAHHYESINDGEPYRDPLTKTLQKETISDIYASMVTIRDTGNLDTVKYTVLPFRMMPNTDSAHQSTVSLRKFIDDFDNENSIRSLEKLSNLELYKKAEEYYSKNNINIIRNDIDNFFKAEELFKSLMTNEISMDNLERKIELGNFAYSSIDEINQISLWEDQEKTVDYGKSLIKTYIDHLNYHQKLDDVNALSATIRFISKTYHFMENREKAEDVERHYGEENPNLLKKVIFDAVKDMGISLDENSQKMEKNMSLMKAQFEKDKERRDQINNELNSGSYKFEEIKLNVNPNTKSKILERLKRENAPEINSSQKLF